MAVTYPATPAVRFKGGGTRFHYNYSNGNRRNVLNDDVTYIIFTND